MDVHLLTIHGRCGCEVIHVSYLSFRKKKDFSLGYYSASFIYFVGFVSSSASSLTEKNMANPSTKCMRIIFFIGLEKQILKLKKITYRMKYFLHTQ